MTYQYSTEIKQPGSQPLGNNIINKIKIAI